MTKMNGNAMSKNWVAQSLKDYPRKESDKLELIRFLTEFYEKELLR